MYTVLFKRGCVQNGNAVFNWIEYPVDTLQDALNAWESWALDYRIRDNTTGVTYTVEFVDVDDDYCEMRLGKPVVMCE